MATLPWYKFHASDWQRSMARASMTMAERGLYRELLDIANTEGFIPKNPWVLIRLSGASEQEFNSAWPAVSKMFGPDPDDPEKLVNHKAADVYHSCSKYLERQKLNGAKGGRGRKREETHGLSDAKPKTNPRAKRIKTKSDTDTDSICIPPTPLEGSGGNTDGDQPKELDGNSQPQKDLKPEDVQRAWKALLERYPPAKTTNVGLAERYFVDTIRDATDRNATFTRMLKVATLFRDRCRSRRDLRAVPGLKNFLADHRYTEAWERILPEPEWDPLAEEREAEARSWT